MKNTNYLRLIVLLSWLATGQCFAGGGGDSLSVVHSFSIHSIRQVADPLKVADTSNAEILQPGDLIRIDDYLLVRVADTNNIHALDTLLKKYPGGLILWLNGIAFPELKPLKFNPQTNELLFQLKCDTCKKTTFGIFYSYTVRRASNLSRMPFDVQLGTKEKPVTVCGKTIVLQLKVPWMGWAGYSAMVILLLVFLIMVLRRGLLRDYIPFDSSVTIVNQKPPAANQVFLGDIPYSLARTQLAVWTLLIAFSQIYIWIQLDELSGLNETVIVLLGISGGTSVVARMIEAARNDPSKCLTAAQFYSGKISKGFFSDLLGDEKGVSVHRFQLLLFTGGLSLYFIWHVVYYLELPTFSSNQLLLMGVSNSTYAGIKFNEK